MQAYCGCAVGKIGLRGHVIATLLFILILDYRPEVTSLIRHLQIDQMECTETLLVYLMSYVPENKAIAYFRITKIHVLSALENNPLVTFWTSKPRNGVSALRVYMFHFQM